MHKVKEINYDKEKNMFQKIKKGDTIGVIAPSSKIDEDDLEAINNSVLLMESTGLKVKFARNAFSKTLGYSATPEEKAEDIKEMFLDNEVKMIFAVSGGFNSNSLFEYLDYDVIRNNPKPLCGFSDTTSLTNVIYEKTGVITFNGPTFKALTSWGTPYAYEEVYGSDKKQMQQGDSKAFREGSAYSHETYQEHRGDGACPAGIHELFEAEQDRVSLPSELPLGCLLAMRRRKIYRGGLLCW